MSYRIQDSLVLHCDKDAVVHMLAVLHKAYVPSLACGLLHLCGGSVLDA